MYLTANYMQIRPTPDDDIVSGTTNARSQYSTTTCMFHRLYTRRYQCQCQCQLGL